MAHRSIPLAVVLLTGISLLAAPPQAKPKVVRTQNGLVSGQTDEHGVTAYLGIPFAAPPVGKLRWRAPQPAASWKGVRPADHFGAGCMQDEVGERLPWTREFMTQGPISEDCLYLNVWTAYPGSRQKHAVMVYIYGGGFTEGSSQVAVYNGANLAREGVVMVTLNYRVGALGFLAYPALTAESAHHSSGNYGLLDQIAALRWVHRNIAAFGGDPANVTIFGQSAGAMSVGDLIQSPLAQGLFAHAIAESGLGLFPGSVSRNFGTPLAEAEKRGVQYAEARGAHSLAELRAMPAADFFKPVPGAGRGMPGSQPGGPDIDGWVIPQQPLAHQVPLIDGMVAGDTGLFSAFGNGAPKTVEEYEAYARKIYGDKAAEFLKLYPVEKDSDIAAALKASATDRARVSMFLWSAEQSRRGPVHTYYFDRAIPWPQHPEFGAFHTSEVPYIFQTISLLDRPWKPIDFRVSRMMSSYWTNFAKTGNPSGPNLPNWPEYNPNSRTTMELGQHFGPIPVASGARFDFYEGILTK
jgi:para-nitrobenzyl esterase